MMRKIYLAVPLLVLGLVVAGSYAPQARADTGSTMPSTNVMVMTHICDSSVKNLQDFQNLEKGHDPVGALANTVLHCPATGLPGNAAVAGTVASPRTIYDFTIMGDHGTPMMLSNGNYMQHKICESDINKDVNGDGMISPTTCLDISHYEFPNVTAANSRIQVTEVTPPPGTHFGALRFTPPALAQNNDQQSLVAIDAVQGRIQLDTTNNMNHSIMLHVYNFMNSDASNMARGMNDNGMSAADMTMSTTSMNMGSTTMNMGSTTDTGMNMGSTTMQTTRTGLISEIQMLISELNTLLSQLASMR